MRIEQRIAAVRADREHGSRWLMHESVMIMRDLAQQLLTSSELEEQKTLKMCKIARKIAGVRPAMAGLASAMGRLMAVQGGPGALVSAAERLLSEIDTATQQIAHHAGSMLHDQLMTCSFSGTVLEVLTAHAGQIEQVIVLEGRPGYEGRALAEALIKQGITVTLITDAQADIFMSQCRAVVVGADSVLADGSVLNKAGTALLGWSARGHGVPFYVLCETLKISPERWNDDLVDRARLEEHDSQEVLPIAGENSPLAGMQVRNYYFDRTPPQLITSIITERGSLALEQIEQIAIEAKQNQQILDDC